MDLAGFLSTVVSLVRHNQRSGAGLNAAVLGNLIRSQAGLDWIDHGFPRLSDALNQLESAGEIRIVRDPRAGLVVFPAEKTPPLPAAAQAASTEQQGVATTIPVSRSSRPLKKAVWNAFVAATPTCRRLLNRQSGEAWLTPDQPPPPTDDWRIVEPIPADQQRAWARTFVESAGLSSDRELSDSIGREDWFRVFPVLLTARRGPSVVGAWNRIRSEHVVRYVEAWAQRNEVRPDTLFDAPRPGRERAADRPTAQPELRSVLLDAIRRMSLDDLLSIPIPARHLLAAIRPELLREG